MLLFFFSYHFCVYWIPDSALNYFRYNHIQLSQKPYEVYTITIPILKMENVEQ